MKLGLLADIHEHVEELRRAIDVLSRHGADRFVVLGDVFETGKRVGETVLLLREVDAVGVTASPAISGNALLFRTDSHLYCIGEARGK